MLPGSIFGRFFAITKYKFNKIYFMNKNHTTKSKFLQ